MICRADTMGVFQIESRAQMSMLPRLKPRCFYDLVIEVAIVRPGPIQGNMVHPYLRRRAGEEPVSYPRGDSRRVAQDVGGTHFSGAGDASGGRGRRFHAGRGGRTAARHGAWRRPGVIDRFRAKLLEGMRAHGLTEQFAEDVFRQIRGFGEYGFPESHAASFALLVYVSAWLKHYYPACFTAALLNSQPLGFYAPSQLVQDARRHGFEVRAPRVCDSDWDCTVEEGALRLGLRMVKGLRADSGHRVARHRPYDSVAALAVRARLRRDELELLARAGALEGLAGHRYRAAWAVAGVEPERPLAPAVDDGPAVPLLPAPGEGQDLVADYATLGLTVGRHPLALLRDRLHRMRLRSAEDLWSLPDGAAASAAGLVVNRQRPGTASGVVFMTLEDETGHINVIVWGRVAERQADELNGARLMVVRGEVQREGDVQHLVARRLEDHSHLVGALATRSRDYR
jgi:error-prone DNA polymerase